MTLAVSVYSSMALSVGQRVRLLAAVWQAVSVAMSLGQRVPLQMVVPA